MGLSLQVGCEEQEKEEFWRSLDCEISVDEKYFIGGDLNGHIGTERAGIVRVHGVAWDLAVINTFFMKTEDQYAEDSSGGRESQIDFVLCRRSQLKEVTNCKVIKGECVSSQHRSLIVDTEIKVRRKGKQVGHQKVKWWMLKDKDLAIIFKNRVMEELEEKDTANGWWEASSKVVVRMTEEVLGKTSSKGPPRDKETRCWNDEVQQKVLSNLDDPGNEMTELCKSFNQTTEINNT
ncbi:uncharacterized protein [Diabrotica undecimpunctata]|uniref:uncharacterized protein n=1 Tax=Diabrotica undecimpunctata TaxID=50387 RepID=UPI003B63C0E4